MPKPQFDSGWAVCHDVSGVMTSTVRRTRREAINAFLEITGGQPSDWRRYQRRGWRASLVSITEHLFQ